MKRTGRSNRNAWIIVCLLVSLTCISCSRVKTWYYYQKATDDHNRGDLTEAIRLYKETLNIDPSLARVQYDLGVAYLDNHDYKAATVQIRKLEKMGHPGMAGQLRDLRATAENLQDN